MHVVTGKERSSTHKNKISNIIQFVTCNLSGARPFAQNSCEPSTANFNKFSCS